MTRQNKLSLVKRGNRECICNNGFNIRFNMNPYKGFPPLVRIRLNWKAGTAKHIEAFPSSDLYKKIMETIPEYKPDNKASSLILEDTRYAEYYYAYIDFEDLDKIMSYSELWYFDKSGKRVSDTARTTSMHGLILKNENPDKKIHHLNTDIFVNSKKNLLIVTKKQHDYYHTIIEKIKDKGNFSRERLILELSENVIGKMRKTTHEEYKFRLILFENSLTTL